MEFRKSIKLFITQRFSLFEHQNLSKSVKIENMDKAVFVKIPKMDIIVPNDHRMVMIASLLLMAGDGGSISPHKAVNKSFPEFFENFERKSAQ